MISLHVKKEQRYEDSLDSGPPQSSSGAIRKNIQREGGEKKTRLLN